MVQARFFLNDENSIFFIKIEISNISFPLFLFFRDKFFDYRSYQNKKLSFAQLYFLWREHAFSFRIILQFFVQNRDFKRYSLLNFVFQRLVSQFSLHPTQRTFFCVSFGCTTSENYLQWSKQAVFEKNELAIFSPYRDFES